MSSPYRTRQGLAPPQAPRDTGIVGDIIDQFADRYAFMRELVQNAIDAETATIEVRATYDAGDHTMTMAVIDEGIGMPREVIEERLLVLFRSTKEDDDSKIGKFGVGFASVLAVDPSLVRVTTAHDGERHTLHLFRDLSYELFESGRANLTGTSVEIEIELPGDQVEDFITSSLEALMRWCRHATVPIFFTGDAGPLGSVARTRIDRPLALDNALIEVAVESSDGAIRAAVGLADDGEPYAGFFNHGLTLFETREPLAGKLAFKVQDGRLGHTLSRDNVRRDGRFRAAVDFVSRTASRQLTAAATRALASACEDGDIDRYTQLAEAIGAADLDPEWVVPLVEPLHGKSAISLVEWASTGCFTSAMPNAITTHLTERGIPVSRLTIAEPGALSALGATARPISELTLVTPIDSSEWQADLLQRTRSVLGRVHRKPTSIFLAELDGLGVKQTHVACSMRADYIGEPFLVDVEEAMRDPFAFFRRCAIAINRDHPTIEALLELEDGETAAALLSRLLLLGSDRLSVERSTELLEHDLDRLGINK